MAEDSELPGSGAGSRRARRARRQVAAFVTVNPEAHPIKATACDVSETGLKIAVDTPIEPGPITVKLVGMPIFSGEVRWQGGRHIGVRLTRPLPSDSIDVWIETHGNRG